MVVEKVQFEPEVATLTVAIVTSSRETASLTAPIARILVDRTPSSVADVDGTLADGSACSCVSDEWEQQRVVGSRRAT